MYIFIYIIIVTIDLDLGKRLSRIFRDNTEEADFGENFSATKAARNRSRFQRSWFSLRFSAKRMLPLCNPLYKHIVEKRIKIRIAIDAMTTCRARFGNRFLQKESIFLCLFSSFHK
jgi:hypothetical protein